MASGNHRAPDHKPDLGTLACVHYFVSAGMSRPEGSVSGGNGRGR
ncbi:hypothetical protein ABT104_21080 [Streptomyces mobaraensis]